MLHCLLHRSIGTALQYILHPRAHHTLCRSAGSSPGHGRGCDSQPTQSVHPSVILGALSVRQHRRLQPQWSQGCPQQGQSSLPFHHQQKSGCTRGISPIVANVMVQGPRPSCMLNDWTQTQYGDSRTGLGHVRPAPFIGRVTCPVMPVLDGCGVGCKPALGEWLVHSNN